LRSEEKGSTSLSERDNVMEFFRPRFKKSPDVAGGLPDALLVLDQRKADETLAIFPKADPGRNRDFGLFNQQSRKLDTADGPEDFRQRRPGKHGSARRRDVPSGAAE